MNTNNLINKNDEILLKVLELMEEKLYNCNSEKQLSDIRKKRILWRANENFNVNIHDFIENKGHNMISVKGLDFLLHNNIDISSFDINNDGLISKDEFKKMIKTLCKENNIWAIEYCISKEWSDKYINTLITNAINQENCCNTIQQQLLISYGPPGSGKSTTVKEYLTKYPKIGFIDINIDSIVKDYMTNILHSEELFNDQEIYFKVRSGWPDYTKHKLLDICLKNNYNFHIETTGNNINTLEYIVKPALEQNYNITMLYTLVPFMELIYRVIKRETLTGQGHPDFRNLLNMCKSGFINIVKYKDLMKENGVVVYIDNTNKDPIIIENNELLQQFLIENNFNESIISTLNK